MSSFYKNLSRRPTGMGILERVRKKSLQWLNDAAHQITRRFSRISSSYHRRSQRRETIRRSKRYSNIEQCLAEDADHKFILRDVYEPEQKPKEPPKPQYHPKLPCRWEWQSEKCANSNVQNDHHTPLPMLQNKRVAEIRSTICEAVVHDIPVHRLSTNFFKDQETAATILPSAVDNKTHRPASFYV